MTDTNTTSTPEAKNSATSIILPHIRRLLGEAHDCPVANRILRRVGPAMRLLADKAYDSGELRDRLNAQGTKPIIPNRSNRTKPFRFSKRRYKLRWRFECAFNRLKVFRRFATRYDKLAQNYLASVCLTAALVWWI